MTDNIDKDEIRMAIDRLQIEHPLHYTVDATKFNDGPDFNAIQRAIDVVAKKCADDAEINIICEMAKLYLEGVKPTIDRPHGEWIDCEDNNYCKCSICGNIVMAEEITKYCGSCGASMEVK